MRYTRLFIKTSLTTVQCDENWPRCGNCKRSNQVCSGPPVGVKFVQNNCHSARGISKLSAEPQSQSNRTPSPCGTLVDVKLQPAADGHGAFHQMRIVRDTGISREVPPTPEEKLATKLSHAMASDANSLLLSHELLANMIPQLSSSTVLRDALSCLLATSTNLHRSLTFQDILDQHGYNRALKSLPKALKDPSQQYTTSTLAALTIIYHLELSYDSSGGPNKTLHATQLYNLLSTRGAPSLEDPLAIHLAFENLGPMLSYTLLTDSPNFYADPTWLWTLQTGLDIGMVMNKANAALYTLHLTLANWPSLASTLRNIHADPLHPFTLNLAMDLLNASNTLNSSLQTFEDSVISSLFASGDICYLTSNVGFSFSSLAVAQLFSTHAMASIAASQITQSVNRSLGLDTPAYDITAIQTAQWAERIRMCISYATSLGSSGSFLVPALVLAYGVENMEGRREVMEGLAGLERWKYPGGQSGREKGKAEVRCRWDQKAVLEMGVVICGRGTFGGVVRG